MPQSTSRICQAWVATAWKDKSTDPGRPQLGRTCPQMLGGHSLEGRVHRCRAYSLLQALQVAVCEWHAPLLCTAHDVIISNVAETVKTCAWAELSKKAQNTHVLRVSLHVLRFQQVNFASSCWITGCPARKNQDTRAHRPKPGLLLQARVVTAAPGRFESLHRSSSVAAAPNR